MITGILLSAGLGTRFGGEKCSHRLPSGVAVGVQSARNLAPAVDHLVCVIRANDEALDQLYNAEGFEVVRCRDAGLGISASLRAGIRASPRAAGWLIALGDMPWIQPSTSQSLASMLREHGGIIAPVFNGDRGHPVAFSARYGDALCALEGDTGARPLLQEYADTVRWLEVEDDGILADIDEPGDLLCEP